MVARQDQVKALSPLTQREETTIGYFRAALQRFEDRKACLRQVDSCRLVRREYETLLGRQWIPSLACVNQTSENRDDHFSFNFGPMLDKIDTVCLARLSEEGTLDSTSRCTTIEQQTSRKMECGVQHPQARSGKLIKHESCGARFYIFIPLDITTTPYAIFISTKKHSHPPPPPTKPPSRFIDDLINIMARVHRGELTRTRFELNPLVQRFCAEHSGKTLAEVHSSFANGDIISMLLTKQRRILYPEAQDFLGVEFLYETDAKFRVYIQRPRRNYGHLRI